MDHDRYDYESRLVTNAMTTVEAKAQKTPIAAVQIYLAEETLVEGVEISCDGVRWDKLDRNDLTLPPAGTPSSPPATGTLKPSSDCACTETDRFTSWPCRDEMQQGEIFQMNRKNLFEATVYV